MPISYLLILLAVVIVASGITITLGYSAGLLGLSAVGIGFLAARIWVARK